MCDSFAEGLAETVAEIGSLGGVARPAVLDVRDRDAVQEWIGSLSSESDALHLVVNNAGGGFHSDFESLSAGGQAALIAKRTSRRWPT